MRVLVTTYGSRGDVEPIVGLAVHLRALGAEVRMCAPPDEEFAELLARVDRRRIDQPHATQRRHAPGERLHQNPSIRQAPRRSDTKGELNGRACHEQSGPGVSEKIDCGAKTASNR